MTFAEKWFAAQDAWFHGGDAAKAEAELIAEIDAVVTAMQNGATP